MSATPSPGSAFSYVQTQNRDDRTNRRNPATAGSERNAKQRSQRATWACERCRIKKLRCTGGHPCSACGRAEVECDFGERSDPNLNISITKRLVQLERTVTELVANSSPLPDSRQPDRPVQSTACLPSSLSPSNQPLPNAVTESPSNHHHVRRFEQAGAIPRIDTLTSVGRTAAGLPDSYDRHSGVILSTRDQGPSATPGRMHSSAANSGGPEGLESRWAALQRNTAPFPPLMGHPTVWSGEPAKESADRDSTARSALGLTSYTAKVDLRSEPIINGIVSESLARLLFALFYQKCHPLFPILDSTEDLNSKFDHIRSSSPFLFTVILSIAGRYYTGYREAQSATSIPTITDEALGALADLACAHLGFVIFRKQHQLSDVQATLLLSVWIPRGQGQSADQWMVAGISNRLAYRIGVPDSFSWPAISTIASASSFDAREIIAVNDILRQWHTWLIINLYDTSLSLGFGRPHLPVSLDGARIYLNIVRKLGRSSIVDPTAAAYVVSLVELSAISTDLICGLRLARSPETPSQNPVPRAATVWPRISTLLSELNPRLDEWQRQWTWNGSYDAISLGNYITLCKIYGEHIRLCVNSLSLNALTDQGGVSTGEVQAVLPCLARACESAVTLVQHYAQSVGVEPVIRYGGDYLVLILGQAAVFLIRAHVSQLDQPLPMDRLVLEHYLKVAIELLEFNDFSTTGVCGWVAQLSRALARHAGVAADAEGDPRHKNPALLDPSCPVLEWDFDISFPPCQNLAYADTGFDLGHYFDFAQSYYPASSSFRGS